MKFEKGNQYYFQQVVVQKCKYETAARKAYVLNMVKVEDSIDDGSRARIKTRSGEEFEVSHVHLMPLSNRSYNYKIQRKSKPFNPFANR